MLITELKQYIYNNDKTSFVLEQLGCHNIKFNPVKKADIPINKMETIVPDVWVSNPRSLHILSIICPIVQIKPPTQKALKQFFRMGEFGDFLST